MESTNSYFLTNMKEFTKGIFRENPVLILLLGLCPALAVSSSIVNAIGMGLATTFVLLSSNIIISLFGRFFPSKIRIPCYIVVIATFVTITEMVMSAYTPALNKALGIFIPLIVVNCVVLGRAEAFASKNKLLPSILDGLGMGTGFTLALMAISFFREVLGSGTFFNIRISEYYAPQGPIAPATVMIMAPGAFIVIALLIGFINLKKEKQIKKS